MIIIMMIITMAMIMIMMSPGAPAPIVRAFMRSTHALNSYVVNGWIPRHCRIFSSKCSSAGSLKRDKAWVILVQRHTNTNIAEGNEAH